MLNAYQQAARDIAVAALNAAITFDDHPTFNTKTTVLRDLARAEGALDAIVKADGTDDFRAPIVGIDPMAFAEVVSLVKGRPVGGTHNAIRRAVIQTIIIKADR